MKVTIEIDCTPTEAREFLGLPDIREIQKEWLDKTRNAMLADAANFSPESLVRSWAGAAAPNLDMMQDLFAPFLRGRKSDSDK